ncbi:nitrogen fixation protein NifQ [Pararhodospirillum photometricum]|nr:nitrogen fixation protein NifQ [Pararhodospirillum photometricum]
MTQTMFEPRSPSLAETLMAIPGAGDPFDRLLFAHLLAAGAADSRPLSDALGLLPTALRTLVDRFFPGAGLIIPETPPGPDAPEEPDLRALLLAGRAHGTPEEEWLATILARRSLLPNHLWQDLGLRSRSDLSTLLTRHFTPLARRNTKNMKWKKFFYRELCQQDGILVCKSPLCDACSDYSACFGPEG